MQQIVIGDYCRRSEERHRPASVSRAPYAYALRGTPPPTSILLELRTPIADQGSLSSCVANAVTTAIEHNMQTPVELSRRDLYWKARALEHDGSSCRDEGSNIPIACKSAIEEGVCRESDAPYIEKEVNRGPTEAQQSEAWRHRLPQDSYQRISGDRKAGILSALHEGPFGRKVVIGVALLARHWQEYDWTSGPIGVPPSANGGHAITIAGYIGEDVAAAAKLLQDMCATITESHDAAAKLANCYIVQNSWSEGWGLYGYGFLSADYVHGMHAYDLSVLRGTPAGMP
jgi:C1A family cysteine protease